MKLNEKIRNTNIVLLLFIILPFITFGQRKNYTLNQMKDTISKFDDIFIAFDKLEAGRTAKDGYTLLYGYPSYDSIRNDVELRKSLLGLLDIKEYKNHRLKEFENNFKKDISKKKIDSLQFIRNYLKWYVCEECSSGKINKLTDSIKSNPIIFKTVFATAVANRLKIEEKDIMNSSLDSQTRKYLDFLYPTQWYEVRDFVKENLEGEIVSYKTKVLIEMNDQKAMAEFEQYFTEILNNGKLDYEDYIFVGRFYYNKNFKIKLFLKILQCSIAYYIDPFEKGEITTTENKDTYPLEKDIFYSLISYPLEEKDFMINDKFDYNKVIQFFESKIKE